MVEIPLNLWGPSSAGEHMFVIVLGLKQCETEDHGVPGSTPGGPIYSVNTTIYLKQGKLPPQ